MLEAAPLEEGKGGNRKATASAKEALKKEGNKNPSLQGGRGPLLKIRRPRPQSGGRNLHQRVLRQEKPRPPYFPKGINPPASRKKKGEFCNKGHPCFYF